MDLSLYSLETNENPLRSKLLEHSDDEESSTFALLREAMCDNNIEVLLETLHSGGDVNERDEAGRALLHCIKFDTMPATVLALGRNADVFMTDNLGCCPLHIAATNCSPSNSLIINYFLERGVPVDARDLQGNTPLHYAASASNQFTMKILIECGANVSAINNQRQTPLDAYYEKKKQNGKVFKIRIFKGKRLRHGV
eukprot:TRINITY_DN31138_c0_g1_i1.p1 TRINITY_DN31138_c0_g1~~TRINITY_DN31138_c0_g1_i1.p1  ORF type:complete len:197 (+),score=19.23 TRINITY_DN31138_c0_g1_i1:74-664(+)